jgi:hypothetical protein
LQADLLLATRHGVGIKLRYSHSRDLISPVVKFVLRQDVFPYDFAGQLPIRSTYFYMDRQAAIGCVGKLDLNRRAGRQIAG